jgi:hypothetical protein
MGMGVPPAPLPPPMPDGRANGFMLQGRIQAQSSLVSLGGGPSFMLGYQGPNFALGLGIGLNHIGVSTTQDSASANVTLFQIMPTALIDVWHSADGRAHANLIGAIGYGRASASVTSNSQSCPVDQFGNNTLPCTTQANESSAGASFVPFMLGFGGDYYLSRNFALGSEVGLQGLITTGIDSTSGGTTTSIDGAGNLQVLYAALRATFIIGD